jgi:hypothetical protein
MIRLFVTGAIILVALILFYSSENSVPDSDFVDTPTVAPSFNNIVPAPAIGLQIRPYQRHR